MEPEKDKQELRSKNLSVCPSPGQKGGGGGGRGAMARGQKHLSLRRFVSHGQLIL